MKKLVLALATAAALLAGCASSPSGPTSGATPAAKEQARLAAPVAVPATARRKVILAMTGPKNVVEAKDWPEFKREWRETFAEHAKQSGIAFSFVDTEPKPTGEDGTILYVDVADYRIVGIGAKIFFGVMTGNAYIEAKVRYTSLRDGAVFGEQPYSTSSSAWRAVSATWPRRLAWQPPAAAPRRTCSSACCAAARPQRAGPPPASRSVRAPTSS